MSFSAETQINHKKPNSRPSIFRNFLIINQTWGAVALSDKNFVSSPEFQEKFWLPNFCSKIFVKRGRTGKWQSYLLCLKCQSNRLPFSNMHFSDAQFFYSSLVNVSYCLFFCAATAKASAMEDAGSGEIDLELGSSFMIWFGKIWEP